MSKHPKTRNRKRANIAGTTRGNVAGTTRANVASTTRPDTPELEGGTPLPEELTGRASRTRESLGALFANAGAQHMADGFRGGSNDDAGSDIPKGDDTRPDAEEDVTAV